MNIWHGYCRPRLAAAGEFRWRDLWHTTSEWFRAMVFLGWPGGNTVARRDNTVTCSGRPR